MSAQVKPGESEDVAGSHGNRQNQGRIFKVTIADSITRR